MRTPTPSAQPCPDATASHERARVDRSGRLAKAWAACRPIAGTILIVLGLLLTVVPVLPGTPLVLLGVTIAGASHPATRFLRRVWHRLRGRRDSP